MLSLALFIDKLEDVSDAVSASKPGVMFRPPDYPGVLITPEESTPNSTTGALAFGHGKSCLLRWPEEAGAVAIEMYLVDLVDAPAKQSGVLLGAAVHSIPLDAAGATARVRRIKIQLRDVVGNAVAVLHGRCRCQHLGAALLPHLHAGNYVQWKSDQVCSTMHW